MPNSIVSTVGAVTQLKVLTVNIHKGFTSFNRRFMLHELRDAVRHVHADVVFLQEVLGTHARHAARLADYPEAPHYEFLADSIWPQFAYGKNAAYPHGHHGNAVLSKFPIVHQENRDVSLPGPERRGLLHCVLQVPGSRGHVHVFCVHLGLRESHRREQLRLLAAMIEKEVPAGQPVIVAGDFNDWRRRAHDILEKSAGLREVFVHATGQAAKTFPAKFPVLSLDRIYVRDARAHSPITLPGAPWNRLSDHAPLAAVIDL
ncbi:endonuclease/exonuclease/phosphatase family protein [Pseudorhodoferax sp.]|uniref:endonuclease/exonuclease/phosphatase family protein n=1 Tax=Pseudorhodoferax sp. TaxID=1993553 RepID=UPI0039E4903A